MEALIKYVDSNISKAINSLKNEADNKLSNVNSKWEWELHWERLIASEDRWFRI